MGDSEFFFSFDIHSGTLQKSRGVAFSLHASASAKVSPLKNAENQAQNLLNQ
jgi:hypothetical protein